MPSNDPEHNIQSIGERLSLLDAASNALKFWNPFQKKQKHLYKNRERKELFVNLASEEISTEARNFKAGAFSTIDGIVVIESDKDEPHPFTMTLFSRDSSAMEQYQYDARARLQFVLGGTYESVNLFGAGNLREIACDKKLTPRADVILSNISETTRIDCNNLKV